MDSLRVILEDRGDYRVRSQGHRCQVSMKFWVGRSVVTPCLFFGCFLCSGFFRVEIMPYECGDDDDGGVCSAFGCESAGMWTIWEFSVG